MECHKSMYDKGEKRVLQVFQGMSKFKVPSSEMREVFIDLEEALGSLLEARRMAGRRKRGA